MPLIFVASYDDHHHGQSETDDYLLASLRYTRGAFENQFGAIEAEPHFLTFDFDTTELFPTNHRVRQFFDRAFRALGAEEKLRVIVNGWDGLTTSRLSFLQLFEQHQHQTELFIFAEEPRRFHEVSVREVCEVFTDRRRKDDERLSQSTRLFLSRFDQIYQANIRIKEAKQALRDLGVSPSP